MYPHDSPPFFVLQLYNHFWKDSFPVNCNTVTGITIGRIKDGIKTHFENALEEANTADDEGYVVTDLRAFNVIFA